MAYKVVPDRQGIIQIGKIKENLVTEVELPAPGFGGGSYAVLLLRPKAEQPYPVTARHEGGSLVWTVHTRDTEIPGTGKVECRWYGDNGEVAKSQTYMVRITNGLPDPTEAPEAWEGFMGQVARNAELARAAAEAAKTARSGAEAAKLAAGESATGAAGSAEAAAQAAQKGENLYNQVKADLAAGKLKGEKGDKGDPGKDAPQIDDAVISAENPWSSRHIVETLCPPISETGNPVTCYPVAGYPLGVVASWEPTQAGTGDPSPENIRPISGRTEISVERCGVNLLDISKCTGVSPDAAYGLAVSLIGDIVRITGTPSVKKDVPNAQFRILRSTERIPGRYNAKCFVAKGTVTYVTVIQKDGSIVAQAPLYQNTPVDIELRIMFYVGDAPTTYTPYRGDTLALALPSTIYGGTLDAVTGAGDENAKIITVDGNEMKFTANATGEYWNLPMRSAPGVDKVLAISHFANSLFSANLDYSFIFTQRKLMQQFFQSIGELNAYCAAQYAAGTPVQIAYKLATPTPITATGNAEIMPIPGEINTVMTDADSVTVTGLADPIRIIQQLQAQLATATQQLDETQQEVVDTTAMTVDYIYQQDLAEIGLEEVDDSDNQTDTEPVDVP